MEVTKFTGRANINLYRGDCNVAMAGMRAGQFDLAIVDPPYGIGEDGGDKKRTRKGKKYNKVVTHEKKKWDDKPPDQEYFDNLRRVSKNQIIWGGNYFIDKIKTHSMGWIFWDKKIGGDFSDGELAWTSFNKALRMVSKSYHQGTHGGHDRIQPTQKPVALYKWLLTNYAKPGDTILDTHGGSMSIAIAAWDLEFDLDLYELDADYYKAGVERVRRHISQMQFDL